MAVRSNYIKKLMEEKNSLDKQYQEVIAESMKNIIGENAKDEVRKLLKEAEDEDSYEEEEVEDIDTNDADKVDNEEDSGDTDDELWDDLEKCKSADGEYDCRGMEDGKLINILKSMGPEDGIRVMSNGDGTVAVEVDGDAIDGEAEYIIDIDDIVSADDEEDSDVDIDMETEDDFNDDDDDLDVELELDESENKDNLGYKGHPGNSGYQKKTAMTTDPDVDPTTDQKVTGHVWLKHDSADIDKGKDGDRQPYDNNVDESMDECGGNETIFEVEEDFDDMVDEASHTVTQNNGNVRGVTRSFPTNSSSQQTDRNGAPEAQSPTTGKGRGTGDGYKEATNESVEFKKKVNRMWEENRQMKSIIPELNKKLNESMVINASMGYIVRLLNENTTTVDEKVEISNRFAKVNTLEEGKKLYETISEELKRANKRTDFAKQINGQLAEGKQAKQNLVETTMYKSEKVNEALDFMKRLDSIK